MSRHCRRRSPTITRGLFLPGVLIALLLGSIPALAGHAPRAVRQATVSHDQFLAHSEPALAENPRNPNNLLAGSKMFTDINHYRFGIGTYYSTDGGRSWHDNGLLPGLDAYKNGLVSDVSIAFGPGGTAYVCVLVWDGAGTSGIDVLRSRDGGKTFDPPVQVYTDTTGAVFNDKPWIAVDTSRGPHRGTVYVAWNADGSGTAEDPDAAMHNHAAGPEGPDGIAVARSTDYGKTFSDPTVVAPFDADHFYLGAVPAVAPDGRLYIPFIAIDGSGTSKGIAMVRSSDGGRSFTPVRVVQKDVVALPDHLPNGTFRNTTMPSFAVSPRGGALVLAWADYRNRDADIMTSTSTDRGNTWSAPVRVNHDPVGDGKDQFQPAIAAAPNGTFTCAWFDRRFDPGNRLIDEVVAQSANDGRGWGHVIRVTKHSWDPAIGAPRPEGSPRNTFIGDYQALAADNGTVHPLWNDTQNGASQEIRTASIGIQLFRR